MRRRTSCFGHIFLTDLVLQLMKARHSSDNPKTSKHNGSDKVRDDDKDSYYSIHTDDNKNSDFDCDLKNTTDDVELDMEEFIKHTDANVEWVGCTEPEVENNEPFEYE
ncbi:hypothetical protein Tco_0450419 [Tanacetum coccineum]